MGSMLDLIPFYDEVCIVEYGRQFLTGGTPDSIIQLVDGPSNQTMTYVGCCLQEILFRLFGQTGVRISPFVGLAALWFCFRTWLRKTSSLSRPAREALALVAAFLPIFFQSAILTRVDSWSVASIFAALAILGKPDKPRQTFKLASASFFAALSVFIWPTCAMLAPIYPAFCFDLNRKREFLLFCLFGIASVAVLLLPALPILVQALDFTSSYLANRTSHVFSFADIAFNLARETARDPLTMAFAAFGFLVWIKKARYMAILAFLSAVIAAETSSLYTFRFVYLMPYALLMCIDAAEALERAKPRLNATCLWLLVAYGVLTGPVGHLITPHKRLPDNLKEKLAQIVGTGSKRIYAPDYAAYYIGRELGWRQFAYHDNLANGRPAVLRNELEKADAIVLRDWDPYETIQQSCTPYGFLCHYMLNAARREKGSPNKSFAARYGEQFANPWRQPFDLSGFHEVSTLGPIKVFLRASTAKPTP